MTWVFPFAAAPVLIQALHLEKPLVQNSLVTEGDFWQHQIMIMRYFLGFVIWALCATSVVQAAAPLGAGEFEATVTGQTFAFEVDGQSYGMERYLPGRRVIWAFEGAECREGVWHEPSPGLICFNYDVDPRQHCWVFRPTTGAGLQAEFLGDGGTGLDGQPGNEFPVIARPTDAPLMCPGPALGV